MLNAGRILTTFHSTFIILISGKCSPPCQIRHTKDINHYSWSQVLISVLVADFQLTHHDHQSQTNLHPAALIGPTCTSGSFMFQQCLSIKKLQNSTNTLSALLLSTARIRSCPWTPWGMDKKIYKKKVNLVEIWLLVYITYTRFQPDTFTGLSHNSSGTSRSEDF